jgi:hypothetical protein
MDQKIKECIDDMIWDPSQPHVATCLRAVIDIHIRYTINPYFIIRLKEWLTERETHHKTLSTRILKIQKYFEQNNIDNSSVFTLYNHHHNISWRYFLAAYWIKLS